jgi:DNA-binding GntR family transcriptional regulator
LCTSYEYRRHAVNTDLGLHVDRPDRLLRERVTDTLREAILRGQLEPGRRLTERELGELTGVSRTSLREALRHLQAEGLVEPYEGRGLRVTVLSASSVAQLYEVRSFLEAAAVELFVQHASDDQVAGLSKVVERSNRQANAQTRGPNDELVDGALDFFDLIFEGAGNEVLLEMYRSIGARIFVVRRLSIQVKGRRVASNREFREILDAIQNRDIAGASEAARKHVMAAKAAALAALANGLAPSG